MLNKIIFFTLFFGLSLAAVSLNNKGDLLLNSLLQGDIVLSSNSDIIFEHKSDKTNLVRLLNVVDSVAGNICFLTPPNPSPSWESLSDLLEPLYGFGITVVDSNLIYVVGGVTAINSTSNKLYVLDLSTNTWSTKKDLPNKRSYPHVATNSLGTKLYVFGGYNLDESEEVNSMDVYDILSDTWDVTTVALPQNFYHLGASVAVEDTIYFIGGLATEETYNSFYRGIFTIGAAINGTVASFNMEYNTWNYSIPSMPTPRFQTTTFTINNRIYVGGGRDSQFDSSVMDIYDIATNSWLAPTELPGLPLSQASSAVSSNLGFVLGGFSGVLQEENSLVRSTWTFNPRISAWRTDIFPSLSSPRANHRSVALDGYIYVLGGQSNATVLSTVERVLPCF